MTSRGPLLLASQSPRRKGLLEALCFDVRVCPSNVDEVWPGGSVEEAAKALAQEKLEAVLEAEACDAATPALAADTVVVLGEEVLGKPADKDDAVAMLGRLSGREHRVVTGFCLGLGAKRHHAAVTTRVWFRPLSAIEIQRYVATGESLDKAGAYGIQGNAGSLVDHLDGSYTNVVGLPLRQVLRGLDALGVPGCAEEDAP